MIKDQGPQMTALRAEAEALDKTTDKEEAAAAWKRYAEGLERLLDGPVHSALLYDPHDREMTEDSAGAQREAKEQLARLEPATTVPIQLLWRPGADFLCALEVRGQRSATAHGKQGLNPVRGAVLEELNNSVPVFLAFKDGSNWQTAWWSELPAATAISHGDSGDRGSKRFGWRVSEFEKRPGLELPRAYTAREPAQSRLG